jgi:ribosomal protein L44E
MNKPYSASSYKAEYALEAGAKRTAIAARGVGNWWKASFNGGESVVERVRIRNRHDCCGNRLTGTKSLLVVKYVVLSQLPEQVLGLK